MAQDQRQQAIHWLTAAVVKTGLVSHLPAKDVRAAIPTDATTAQAWQRASEAFQLSQDQLAQIVAAAYGLQVTNTRFLQPEAGAFVPEDVARELEIVPIRHSDATIVIATSNPLDTRLEGKVKMLAGRKTVLSVAGPTDIKGAQDRIYDDTLQAEFVLTNLHLNTAMQAVELPAKAQTIPSRATPVERLIRLILFEAVKAGASDVRLEPKERGGKVAFVVGGEVRTFVFLPVAVILRIMARVRHWARSGLLDQEGRMVVRIDGDRHDLELKLEGTEAVDPISISLRSPSVEPSATMAQPEEDAPREVAPDPETPKTEPVPWEAPPLALVVDDEPGDRLLLRTLLKRSGFDIVEAKDGVEAMTRLQADWDFDVVLLDLKMPRMSGLEVLGRIRQTVRTAGMPVIVITASEDPEDRRRLMEAGADDYLIKPINPPRVAERVKALLRRSLPVG
ncbi:MAG: response regulator [Longimicrobiales bacterium]